MPYKCQKCSSLFEISDIERKHCDRLKVPLNIFCPDCRFQLRLITRNELNLYSRKCDMTGEQIVSMYSADSSLKVYSQKTWWGDAWNGDDYGKDFDFNRPFFDQWYELFSQTPKIPVFNQNSENSDYCNNSVDNKNCYLCMSVVNSQDCLYTTRCFNNKDVVSCFDVYKSEICYSSINVVESYTVFFSSYIKNCSDMLFCSDCVACQFCIGCSNLRNKAFCIFNKEVGKEKYNEYFNIIKSNPKLLNELAKRVEQLKSFQIVKDIHISKSENCMGDFIDSSRNCENCFYVKESQDCANCNFCGKLTDSVDSDFTDSTPLSFNSMALEQCYDTVLSYLCVNSSNIFYSHLAVGCKNCFGCSSLKKMNYCILNKQYLQEDYEQMIPRIIEYMKKTGEWGKFFPAKYSPFCYNETIAMEHYPLTKDQAIITGFRWKDADPREFVPQMYKIPENIIDVTDEITKQLLACENCGKNFKVVQKELNFYRSHRLPVPKKCIDCRHLDLLKLRNPRKFLERKCGKCLKSLRTTLDLSRPEKLYCGECYLGELY